MSLESLSGILLVDKPLGITSHDAVMKVRRLARERKIGHTGTLDPLAEGLLVMCVGKATKVAQFLVSEEKTYEAELHLGVRSSTYDAQGVEPNTVGQPVDDLTLEHLSSVLDSFIGKQRQTVPAHSAVHVDGERLHRLTRAGKSVTLPDREIEIESIRIMSYESPLLSIEVICSKGTYIRSLAHDVGNALGCGAYLSKLRRIAVGDFSVRQATCLDELEENGIQPEQLIPIERALSLSALIVTESFELLIPHGRKPSWSDISAIEGRLDSGTAVLVRNSRGSVLALARSGAEAPIGTSSTASPITEYLRVLV